jgi:hypothetical protein
MHLETAVVTDAVPATPIASATGWRKGWGRFVVVLASAAMLAMPELSMAANARSVAFTVHETIPITQGRIVRGHIEGCASPVVRTIRAGSSARGEVTTFSGSKRFDCGSGNTITLAFKVSVSGCDRANTGSWKIARGTGLFAGAQGQGKLQGTYTLGRRPGTFCSNDGVDDRYTGEFRY